MTKKEKQFVAALLKEAADHYGNHGCNDLTDQLVKMFTQEEWVAIFKKFHQWNEHTETPKESHPIYMDWAMMSYFAHVLETEE